MFTRGYLASVRIRATVAIQRHHDWTHGFRAIVERFIATIPIESPGFCTRCHAGLCGVCGKCHACFVSFGPECQEWKQAFAAIHSIIDADLDDPDTIKGPAL